MGNIINAADLTFNGEEVKAISEAIMEDVFAKPAITEFLSAYTGIKARKQIAFLGRLNGLVGQAHTNGTCAPVENDATITNTEKFWTPVYIDDRFSECWDDLLETFFIYGTKNGVEKSDLTTTEFAVFFIERYKDEIAEMFFRFVWFGDVDAATISASPAGNFAVAGFVAKRWNAFDGIWKQIFTAVAADSARKTTDLAAKNAQATFALQAFNSTDTTNKVVTTMLQNLQFNADYRLREKSDKIIIVTQSVFDQYIRELEAYATGIPAAFEILTDGITVMKRLGVTIYAFSFWDRMIQGYMRNSTGLGYYLPHRAIMTQKQQLGFGTEEVNNLSEVDIFTDKVTKKTYFDFGANLDAKLLQNYMFQAAY